MAMGAMLGKVFGSTIAYWEPLSLYSSSPRKEGMIENLGRYQIIEEIGQGAMGVVYKAADPFIDRLVAVKTINLNILKEDEKKNYEARFFQEARAAGRISHPNIVTIFDLGETDGIAYIAMELMQGKELKNLIDGGKQLKVEEALSIAVQLSAGLSYAHQHGIIHRDIKPSNIMVLDNGLVKIADFGIARMGSSQRHTQSGMIMGSPMYMSPEQIQGKPLDFRSDIFSMGIVLYRMLTGVTPFIGEDINSLMRNIVEREPIRPGVLNSDIPPELEAIIMKCLAKKPEERYQDTLSLNRELEACLADVRHEARPVTVQFSKFSTFWKVTIILLMAIAAYELYELISDQFFGGD
jgi:eukaryotic-like serine/threonine-protein kinase